MPNLLTIPAGLPLAEVSAQHILAQVHGDARARAVVLVPTRRAAVTMRRAFQTVLGGETSLLPRIMPLADIDGALLSVLDQDALDVLDRIPPAMPDWQQRYLLTVQVMAYLNGKQGAATLDYALALAEELMALQQQCARSGVVLTPEKLRLLVASDMAEHWEQSLAFLSILADHWPLIEQALGVITTVEHERLMLHALADAWTVTPPDFAVFVVGSTASQESTAQLLEVIAQMPQGAVILPGIDVAMPEAEWATISAGHPLYHLKHFMDRFPATLSDVQPLGQSPRSLWLDVLSATSEIPSWKTRPLTAYEHVRLIPCAHAE